jgi:hypothetical protein
MQEGDILPHQIKDYGVGFPTSLLDFLVFPLRDFASDKD